MAADLYLWHGPRDLDASAAASLIERLDRGIVDAFESSVDLGWFLRELAQDEPELELDSDVPPSPTRIPIWLAPGDPPAVRFVGVHLPRNRAREVAEDVFGLAAKYDLIVYDPVHGRVDAPIEAMAEQASATFWPRGALRAAVAGGIGLLVAIAAWAIGIPIVSGLVALVGAFMFVLAVLTFVHEVRVAARRR
jgi:hypothetical protein